jgi:hypothetical protein
VCFAQLPCGIFTIIDRAEQSAWQVRSAGQGDAGGVPGCADQEENGGKVEALCGWVGCLCAACCVWCIYGVCRVIVLRVAQPPYTLSGGLGELCMVVLWVLCVRERRT